MKIYCVIAEDLDRNSSGQIVVGPETSWICDRAIQLCKNKNSGHKSMIVCCGGVASSQYDNAWIAGVVHDYITRHASGVRMMPEEARKNSIWEEMQELKRFIIKMEKCGRAPNEIVIVVLQGRSWRVLDCCKYIFQKNKITVKISSEVIFGGMNGLAILSEVFIKIPFYYLKKLTDF